MNRLKDISRVLEGVSLILRASAKVSKQYKPSSLTFSIPPKKIEACPFFSHQYPLSWKVYDTNSSQQQKQQPPQEYSRTSTETDFKGATYPHPFHQDGKSSHEQNSQYQNIFNNVYGKPFDTQQQQENEKVKEHLQQQSEEIKPKMEIKKDAADDVLFNNEQDAVESPNINIETNQNSDEIEDKTKAKMIFKERSVPSTPISRLIHFIRFAIQLIFSIIKEYLKRLFSKKTQLHKNASPINISTDTQFSKTTMANYIKDHPTQQNSSSSSCKENSVNELKSNSIHIVNNNKGNTFAEINDNEAMSNGSNHNMKETIIGKESSSSSLSSSTGMNTTDNESRLGSVMKSILLTESNAEKLAETLCRMRGAALKLGQMLSIQDDAIIPAPIAKALERVRHQADIMPRRQLEQQLSTEFGTKDWRNKYFSDFDMVPIAAASIGQVHTGVLKKDGTKVAVKVQYPGVSDSIDSDVLNLKRFVSLTRLAPPGAFLDNSLGQIARELKQECDYQNEAKNQKRFRDLIHQHGMQNRFIVPKVIEELSTRRILTTEMIPSHFQSIESAASISSQQVKDSTAKKLLELTLTELFHFRFMQTDPNWSNFYIDPNEPSSPLYLIDFGACLSFSKAFTDQYLRVVYGSAISDIDTIIDASRKMGFLTGEETSLMNEAHAKAAMIVGEPFSHDGIYDFRQQEMTKKIQSVIPTMLKHRLTAPPPASYSLHRKLSGCFLLCYKLGAQLNARELLMNLYTGYAFDKDTITKDTSGSSPKSQ